MWERIWEWNVWDALKKGKEVYAIIFKGKRPALRDLSDFSVREVAELMSEYSYDKHEVEYYAEEEQDE